ncbi:hypothetical protein BIV03_04070 [Curtobacterium sp. MCBA15_016]|uniref:hypothetical protein n=1 Tax=Curtobacterium sp. MCBA15_016 TaxID=1898740 RepID=UPI0008DE4825|nr:hypothetical protein [Curtobacterium sp. MCBA15_016]OII18169.1 hypothetical protein BIV03_04070 [Curtobacterium sp. MCBA15_016]
MGNMDDYIALTTRAKAEGGPEALVELLLKQGETKGIGKGAAVVGLGFAVVGGTIYGGKFLWDKYAPTQPKALTDDAEAAVAKAAVQGWHTVAEARELPGDLTLAIGDRFKALVRDGDVVIIAVADREDNPFPVSGAVLEEISDFVIADLDD